MKLYHKNPRQITKKQYEMLKVTLEELGDLSGVIHDLNSDESIGGNQRSRVFDINECEIKLTEEYDKPDKQGTVAWGYVVWKGNKYGYRQVRWTPGQCERANIIANKVGGDFDIDILADQFDLDVVLESGFEKFELDLDLWVKDDPPEDPGADVDRAEELREKWGVESGQLWWLGDHRVICGDCTDAEVVSRVMGGNKADCTVTDPPYCSGGFQETGKSAGSVGTRGTEMIVRDTLSTRGYQSLMRRWISLTDSGVVYIFTDWRMWINLFDIVEESGFGVRNMIVWDKMTPGMGAGWRMQHELVMCGIRVKSPFDPHKAQGNVIQTQRTGNINHATEKPVELLETIMDVTDMANIYYDPFLGSGTTLIACERLRRQCRGVEISPAYVAVTLERWHQMTGETPELLES